MEEHVTLSMVKLIARAHQDTMARIVKQVSRENYYTTIKSKYHLTITKMSSLVIRDVNIHISLQTIVWISDGMLFALNPQQTCFMYCNFLRAIMSLKMVPIT